MTIYFDNHDAEPDIIRCAAYLRYSDDICSPTSIEDQLRNCTELAEARGWKILPEYVRRDAGISGEALMTRPGILSLLQDAKRKPRPFDCVLIDDTSRLGRNLSDVLKVSDIFNHNDAFLYFVTQQLDSRNKSTYRKVLIANGAQDEDYLEGLRARTHRGLKGKALKGYHTGGKRYGYCRIHIEHPTRKDRYGRPAIDHVELEIDPKESAVVERIYTERASGALFTSIARKLNAEKIPAPNGGIWVFTSVREILRNPLYRGTLIWNKTRTVTDPENGKHEARKRPQNEWVTVPTPKLQIISDKLWQEVQELDRQMRRLGRGRLGGMNRTAQSRTYLFSTLLTCGSCSGRICIIQSDRGIAWYGCYGRYYGSSCPNNLKIRHDMLENQLLHAMSEKLLPEKIEAQVLKLRDKIEKTLNEAAATADSIGELEKELTELKREEANVARAITKLGDSDALLDELTAVQSKIKSTKNQLAWSNQPSRLSYDDFSTFVHEKARDLISVLTGDRVLAKQRLSQLISKLILTPTGAADDPVLMVSGDVNLFVDDSGIMPSGAGTRSAKHYAFPLSLSGLQVDSHRSARVPDWAVCNPEVLILPTTEPLAR